MGVVAVLGAGCAELRTPPAQTNLLRTLRPYVREVADGLRAIPDNRMALLEQIAATMAAQLERGEEVKLTFICSHNSRRSQMSQVWAETAAYYYGLHRVHAFSGGTETTACNCRTVTAMRQVGFSITTNSPGENPIYLVRFASDQPAVRAYSKLYHADGNPRTNFIALMTCSQADRKCPVVEGAVARYALHYTDPKLCDDTPDEAAAYKERCREIAREMFYLMSQARRRLEAKEAHDKK